MDKASGYKTHKKHFCRVRYLGWEGMIDISDVGFRVERMRVTILWIRTLVMLLKCIWPRHWHPQLNGMNVLLIENVFFLRC
jgi:hypothetical protein